MDKKREQTKGIKKKHILYLLGGLGTLFIVTWLIWNSKTSKLSVDKNNILIGDVVNAEFNDYIRVNGQVQPITTIQLSAIEGGIVEEKLVEEGAQVKAGQIIVRLSNPLLSLNILDSEAQLAEKQNFLRNTQVTMEQEKLKLKQEKLQLDLDLERKKRKFEQYKKLYNERLVSKEDYLQAKEDYEFAIEGQILVANRQKQDSIYRGIQVEQMEESLMSMRQNMSLVRQRNDNLNIRASVDGQLGAFDVEVGENVSAGSKVGQISILTDYKIEALIDEHYIDRVRVGLDAKFERHDRNYALRVRKVYPDVKDKLFKTDFVFDGERPDNIRTGQTYYINLQLGQAADAILIPKGAFFQGTGGQWIFVLVPDGKKAIKRNITIGQQNPLYYEVTDGLKAGEKVIISNYNNYKDIDELIIN